MSLLASSQSSPAEGNADSQADLPSVVDGPHFRCELVNDLERPVFQKHFILAHLKQWLRQQPGVRAALMSGSGSTVFAVLDSADPPPALIKGIQEIAGEEIWLQPTRLADG